MNTRRLCLVLIVLCSFIGCGCASVRNGKLIGKDMHRVVQPHDVLLVDLYDAFGPPMDHLYVVRVDESGEIQLPLIGKLPVAGKTHGELEGLIKRIYEDNVDCGLIEVKVRPAKESAPTTDWTSKPS